MSDDAEPDQAPGLDPVLRRLWEPPAAPRRGPRPGLSRDKIVDAAFALADAEGLAAVSMARLGEELGVSAMALYRHVSGKDEVLVLLADRIGDELEPLPDGVDWRTGLELWTRRQVDSVLAHPWMLDLPLATMPVGPARVRWLDQGFKALREVRLPAAGKLQLLGLLAQHVLGEGRVQSEAATTQEEPFADLVDLLRRYAGEGELADLAAAFGVTEGRAEVSAVDSGEDEDDIGFGIAVVLDGIEAHLRRLGAV